jgi:hypothetical protein
MTNDDYLRLAVKETRARRAGKFWRYEYEEDTYTLSDAEMIDLGRHLASRTPRKLRKNSRAVDYFQIGLKKLDGRRVGTRVHYRDDAMRETYSATPAEVRALGRMVHDGVKDAYSHWCAQTPARKAR